MLHFHQHSCLFPVFDFMRMLQWNDSKNGTSVQCDAHINACMYCIPDMLYVFTPNPPFLQSSNFFVDSVYLAHFWKWDS